MATRRLPMNCIRETLRLRWRLGLSVRKTATALGLSPSVVSKTTCRAGGAGLDWAQVDELDDEALERALYGERGKISPVIEVDPRWIHREYKRAGVTL